MEEISEITGMRGFASVGVVIFHLFTLNSVFLSSAFPIFSMILSWNSGVDFFFVLSGFLLTVPFMTSKRIELRAYYLKRVFRIFPVYYLCLGLVGSLAIYAGRASLPQLVTSLFFAQSLFPSTFNSINGVNWTLVIEEIFYATLPLFSVCFKGGRWKYSLPAFLVVSLAYRYAVIDLYSNSDLAFHLWQYPSFLGHYAIGASLASLYARGKLSSVNTKTSLPLGGIFAGLVLTQYYVGSTLSIFNNVAALPGILFASEYGLLMLLTLTSPPASMLRSIFTNRAACFAGKISYSTYTWHLPILVGLSQLALSPLTWGVLSVTAALSVATVSYRSVETRFLRLRDAYLAKKALNPAVMQMQNVAKDERPVELPGT